MSSFDPAGVLAAIVSVLEKVGSVEQTITGQGQNPPTVGVGATVWAGPIRPVPKRSGLAGVSIALEVNVRLTLSLSTQPPGSIETALLGAYADACNALVGGFTLGGEVVAVDLLGAWSGGGLRGEPGYVPYDGVTYRCITAVVPVVLDDVWSDAP